MAAKKRVKKGKKKKRSVTKKKVRKRARVGRQKVRKKTSATKQGFKTSPLIGVVTHFFPKVRAAVIKLKQPLKLNKHIRFKGHTTDFVQPVVSMQIDHVPIQKAKKGQEIGLGVKKRVRQGDLVYQVEAKKNWINRVTEFLAR